MVFDLRYNKFKAEMEEAENTLSANPLLESLDLLFGIPHERQELFLKRVEAKADALRKEGYSVDVDRFCMSSLIIRVRREGPI